MDEKNLMSVVVKFYNQKRYVERCLRSVFAQTYAPLEIIVVDDCSTDGSYELAKELAETYAKEDGRHRVSVFRNERNLERAATLARGISLCHGELVFQVDGDDICHPNRVERVVAEWIRDGCRASVIWSQCYEIDDSDRLVGLRWWFTDKKELPGSLGAVMAYKRDSVSGFPEIKADECRDCFDDWIHEVRALLCPGSTVLLVQEALMFYRLGGISSTHGIESRLGLARRRLASMDFMEREISTYSKKWSTPFSRVEELRSLVNKFRHLSYAQIKKYGGNAFKERMEGMKACSNKTHFFSATFLLCDLPVLLFPRSVANRCLELYSLFERIRGRWKFRIQTNKYKALGLLPRRG